MSTIKDLARILSERELISRNEAEQFVIDMFSLIRQTLTTEDQVKIKGLGTFKVQKMRSRSSVNVNTGEKFLIDSHDRITFTPDNSMRDSVNKPFSHFETVILNDGVVFEDIKEEPLSDSVESPLSEPEEATIQEPEIVEAHVSDDDASANYEQDVVDVDSISRDIVPEVEAEQPPVSQTIEEPVNVATQHFAPAQPTSSRPYSAAQPVFPAAQKNESEHEFVSVIEDTQHNIIQPVDDDNQSYLDEEDDYKKSETSFGTHVFRFVVGLAILALGIFIGRITADIHTRDIMALINNDKGNDVKVEYYRVKSSNTSEAVTSKANVSDSLNKKTAVKETKQAIEKSAKSATEASTADVLQNSTPAVGKEQVASTKPSTEKQVVADSKQNTPKVMTQYDSDPRIRTGAYRIIGIDQTVTVRDGEDLEIISRRYLGPGMECYVEAVNGTKSVTVGQKLKIPKLIHKNALKRMQ